MAVLLLAAVRGAGGRRRVLAGLAARFGAGSSSGSPDSRRTGFCWLVAAVSGVEFRRVSLVGFSVTRSPLMLLLLDFFSHFACLGSGSCDLVGEFGVA